MSENLPAVRDEQKSQIVAQIEALLRNNVPPSRVFDFLVRGGYTGVSLDEIKAINARVPDKDRSPLDPLARMLQLEPGEDVGFDPVFEMVKVLMLQRQRFEMAADPDNAAIMLDPHIAARERNAYWYLLKDFALLSKMMQPEQGATIESSQESGLPSRQSIGDRLKAQLQGKNMKTV
ncbi:MAG: hypothetical protein WC977_12555, partial [Anaerovoracaceae bacterium]